MANSTCFSFVMLATVALVPQLATAVAFTDDARKADLLGVYQAALQNDPQLSAARHKHN